MNNQRAITAEILSLYSVTDPNSQGYQTARAQFSGTLQDQAIKAQYLLNPLFGSVLIGKSATQYNNIRYVLSKLGVPLGNSHYGAGVGYKIDHNHHFHITMRPPTVLSIPSKLSADSSQEEVQMVIPVDTTIDSIMLAQAATPPAFVAPAPHWLSDDPEGLNLLVQTIRAEASKTGATTPRSYKPNGPLAGC